MDRAFELKYLSDRRRRFGQTGPLTRSVASQDADINA